MEEIRFDLEWRMHPSGLFVREDGLLYKPKSKTRKAQYTYGSKLNRGYLQVMRNRKIYKVHRLVAECFIPNPNNYPIINHRDENPSNNCVNNLEWCDVKYNTNYGTAIQRRVTNTDWKARTAKIDYKAIAKKQSKKVLQFTLDGELVREFESTRECDRNGFNHSHISKCCNGKLKTAYGYKWKYA